MILNLYGLGLLVCVRMVGRQVGGDVEVWGSRLGRRSLGAVLPREGVSIYYQTCIHRNN